MRAFTMSNKTYIVFLSDSLLLRALLFPVLEDFFPTSGGPVILSQPVGIGEMS